jgi:AraC-like DNA-binding protein
MGTPTLPESCSRLTPLFRGEFFAVDDWRCAGEDTPGRREEWSPDDCVAADLRDAVTAHRRPGLPPASARARRRSEDARCGRSTGRRGARPGLSAAHDLLARDFSQSLTLGGIACEVHCSPFHLSRLFRRATGVTLYRTVVQMRLREGLERLLDQPEHVSTIALAVGFASHSHFTDAFRSEFGCSPSQARLLLGPRRQPGARPTPLKHGLFVRN